MKLVKNSLYNAAGTALPFVVGVATVPVYIATIGTERYGALSIAWVLLGYFGQVDFGIGRAITQRVASLGPGNGAAVAHAVWSALASILIFSFVGAALVYLGADYFFSGPFKVGADIRAELLHSIWALALCNPVVSIAGVAAGALMGIERFKLVSAGTLLSSTAMQILPLLTAFFISHDLLVLVLSALFARLVGFFIFATGAWRAMLRRQKVSISLSEVRHLSKFGIWLMVSAFISPLMMFADRFVIGSYLNAVAVAAYTIPFQVAYRTQILPLAISQALFPRFASEDSGASQDRCTQYTIFMAQLFAPIILGVMSLAGPLLALWLGKHLDPRSIPVAQILLAGIWINAVAQVPYSFIQARGNSRFTATVHILELPFYMGVLIWLGLSFGLPGVAAAFSLRCAIDWFVLVHKAGAINRKLFERVGSQAVVVIVVVLIGGMLHTWTAALCCAAFACSVSTVLALLQMPDQIRERVLAIPYVRSVPIVRAVLAMPSR